MGTETINYLDAIAHLPSGATLRLPCVSWDEYEALLSNLIDWPGLHVSFDGGKVEIMSPLPEHEEYKEFIYSLARTISIESGVMLESRGSTTYRQKRLAKGVEPDTSFYVQNAFRIVGRRTIDLEVDPPPDVVVEIDTTNESLSKFAIYAALGVPEIWRYDGQRASIYQLIDRTYIEAGSSRAFPALTSGALTEFLTQSKTEGQTAALAAFRQWWQANSSPIN